MNDYIGLKHLSTKKTNYSRILQNTLLYKLDRSSLISATEGMFSEGW